LNQSEILKKIKRIEIKTRHIINTVLAGEYHSVFKGRGMEFSEVREYQIGDDIRTIDWNVTARMGHPFIKKFDEERELTVIFVVDASSSGEFGTFRQLKSEIAVELCALLAFSAIKNNDRVGLIIFTNKIEKFILPRKGRNHVLRVIRELLYFKPEAVNTDVKVALDYLNKVITKKSVVFLVSDFLSGDYEKSMRIVNRHHDLIAVTITDPRELQIPDLGLIDLIDAETGEEITVDSGQTSFRDQFFKEGSLEKSKREKFFKMTGIDFVDIYTDRDYVEPLFKFFKKREKNY